MTPRKAGSEEPPAPPPCELCEQIEIDSAFSWCGHRSDHTLDLHAEIAELRAILWQIATDPLQQAELREAIAAVLAPKEGRE